MKTSLVKVKLLTFMVFLCLSASAQQQGSLMDLDSTATKKILSTLKKYEWVGISGYIQPQYQFMQTAGAKSFNGGDYPTGVDNRFMLRRGRLKIEYAKYNKENYPVTNFVFQFDGTERGFVTRDFWGRFYENKYHLFNITTGLFARPFGFEVNYGSSDRESLERGRMSQILMKTERDLGIMLSFDPQVKNHPLRKMKFDVGFFNGQGLSGTFDYDSHKDLISRLSLKPVKLSNKVTLTGSVSGYLGGIKQFTNKIYKMNSSSKEFVLDSSSSNIGKIAPRKYVGADAQLKIKNKVGFTEFRAEYITGLQTATQSSTESPGIIPVSSTGAYAPLYIRKFDGAYFYFLQHLGSLKHQLVVKYDWYDPNKVIKNTEVTAKNTWADIRYNTLGIGYINYINENLKVVFWYEMPKNEKTLVKDYTTDFKDNNFTCRFQYRF